MILEGAPEVDSLTVHFSRCIRRHLSANLGEGFYNFSDICVPVDLFTPSLYKFDVTGKNIEDNHTMEHEHTKKIILFIDEYILIS